MKKSKNGLEMGDDGHTWIFWTGLKRDRKNLGIILLEIPENKNEIADYLLDKMENYPEYTEHYLSIFEFYRKEKITEDKRKITDKMLELIKIHPEKKEYYKKILNFYYK